MPGTQLASAVRRMSWAGPPSARFRIHFSPIHSAETSSTCYLTLNECGRDLRLRSTEDGDFSHQLFATTQRQGTRQLEQPRIRLEVHICVLTDRAITSGRTTE